MANPKEKDDGFDASALAALVTPSHAPPPDADDDEGDDAVLDLKALAASMAPPASEPEPVAAAPRVSTPVAVEAAAPAAKVEPKAKPAARADGDSKPAKKSSQSSKATASSSAQAAPARAARAAEPARVQEVAPEPKKGGAGIWIGIGIAIAATAGIIWYVNQDNNASNDVARADGPSPTSYRNDEPAMNEEPVETPMEEPVEVAPVGSETEPAVEEPVVEEPVVEEPIVEEPVATQMRVETTVMVTAMTETTMAVTAPVEPAMTEPAMTEPAMTEPAMAEPTMAEPTMTTTTMADMELENVLDNAFNTPRPTQMEEPAPAEMPDTPTRANVAQTLGRLMGQIRQCAGDQVGLANAAIIVNSDGSVASVQISGNPFGGTPQGACMEGVIRGARFAPFRQRTFQVRYPFALRAQQ